MSGVNCLICYIFVKNHAKERKVLAFKFNLLGGTVSVIFFIIIQLVGPRSASYIEEILCIWTSLMVRNLSCLNDRLIITLQRNGLWQNKKAVKDHKIHTQLVQNRKFGKSLTIYNAYHLLQQHLKLIMRWSIVLIEVSNTPRTWFRAAKVHLLIKLNWHLKHNAHLIQSRKSPFIDKTELRSETHRALDSGPQK